MKINEIKKHYGVYWEYVEKSVDNEGWVYEKEVSNISDAYFQHNTGCEIEFQKSFGASGDNPNWKTRGARWRPKSISDLLNKCT